jgi:hypothetical protein
MPRGFMPIAKRHEKEKQEKKRKGLDRFKLLYYWWPSLSKYSKAAYAFYLW